MHCDDIVFYVYQVTVNNYECVVKSQSPTEVICSTPASQIAGVSADVPCSELSDKIRQQGSD